MLDHLRTSGVHLTRTEEGGPESGPVPSGIAGKGRDIEEVGDDEDVFDLLVVGGGATGAGTALDAASRGLKVACVERDDFAAGTSSKSTKLVHGGVRYLAKAVLELDYGTRNVSRFNSESKLTSRRTVQAGARGAEGEEDLPRDGTSPQLPPSVCPISGSCAYTC
jgi:NADPH-dependent 2,4-dienoyl-CoA reductase/sulfur reductase-like enzyme